MAPKFGTSGLRGLVTELTRPLVEDYTRAFLVACPTGGAIHVGRDLRPSSPQIAEWVMATVQAQGIPVTDCGALPTPALALDATAQGHGAIMVTGSHIPADRNGLKFYVPSGEISKEDEGLILSALGQPVARAAAAPRQDGTQSIATYTDRYVTAFGTALKGMRIGIYQHSSVARDVIVEVVQALGAEALPLARSDSFIPVDTEALDPATRTMLAGWCEAHSLDAVISTDGDADRPMLADAQGRIVPGDVLGAVTAQSLGAEVISTPVNSNTMVFDLGFRHVDSTRIGSPYVIAAMEQALAADPSAKVAGYEANGGFLLGFAAQGPAGPLAPLMTRDCLLPMLAPLAEANRRGGGLAGLFSDLPQRFTAADRITGVAPDAARTFIATLSAPAARDAFFETGAPETRIDTTDGLRVQFANGDILHLRPSGNAPEFRCYAEAASASRADAIMRRHLEKLASRLAK